MRVTKVLKHTLNNTSNNVIMILIFIIVIIKFIGIFIATVSVFLRQVLYLFLVHS